MTDGVTAPHQQQSTATDLVERIGTRVVGRRREIELVVAALVADRHVVIEGPPGTGKSTLLRTVADELGVGFEFVEGNAELTPARLVGHFDPARVLAEGYDPDVFVDGPLVEALRTGALLYVEELNRVPEETVNLLITVMSEGELHLPRVGRVPAADGFRLVAAMNPFDNVGTARVSGAVYDRICRIAMGYQDADDETGIVVARSGDGDELLRSRAVAVTRWQAVDKPIVLSQPPAPFFPCGTAAPSYPAFVQAYCIFHSTKLIPGAGKRRIPTTLNPFPNLV